jgi:hypothetical protein
MLPKRDFLITAITESSVGRVMFFTIGRQLKTMIRNICLVREDEFQMILCLHRTCVQKNADYQMQSHMALGVSGIYDSAKLRK